jgi:hypothetical protein
MKVEGLIFALFAAFSWLVAVVYGVLANEWIGATALALAGGLGFMVAFYLLFTGRRIDRRPEDDLNAEPSDGAGELGFFSPHSWWPLPLAASAAVIFAGAVFGWWVVAIGIILLVGSLYGFVFEYYRGQRA